MDDPVSDCYFLIWKYFTDCLIRQDCNKLCTSIEVDKAEYPTKTQGCNKPLSLIIEQ
jgi:hypothetical protein